MAKVEMDAGHQEIKSQQEKLAALQAKGKSKSVVHGRFRVFSYSLTHYFRMLPSCATCCFVIYARIRCTLLTFFPTADTVTARDASKAGSTKRPLNILALTPHTTRTANSFLLIFPQVLQSIGPHLSYPIQMQLRAVCDASRREQPEYTCPGCRQEITKKPVVNFVVVVSLVGSALGQPDTRRESSGLRAGPFDAFSPE
ncbi:hypothetical protein EDD22DRAFT_298541 [Suillus occidentalis]|nr:hypothetical protein EDD22DRAFT_298541 [Suillus occidentalis]